MRVKTMNISLPSELVRFIREQVQGGQYSSASEVIRDGLRLLQRGGNGARQEHDEFDRAKVAEALERLRKLSETQVLGEDLRIRDLVDEGRA